MHIRFDEEYQSREFLKRMGEVFTSVITTKSTNKNTKLIFNFIIVSLEIL